MSPFSSLYPKIIKNRISFFFTWKKEDTFVGLEEGGFSRYIAVYMSLCQLGREVRHLSPFSPFSNTYKANVSSKLTLSMSFLKSQNYFSPEHTIYPYRGPICIEQELEGKG